MSLGYHRGLLHEGKKLSLAVFSQPVCRGHSVAAKPRLCWDGEARGDHETEKPQANRDTGLVECQPTRV